MEFPTKIVYDNLYTFKMSASIFSFFVSFITTTYLLLNIKDYSKLYWLIIIAYLVIAGISVKFILKTYSEWNKRQDVRNKEEDLKLKLLENELKSQSINYLGILHNDEIPLIDYRFSCISSSGNHIQFPRVWFIVRNLTSKITQAYFEIEYYVNSKKEDSVKEGHYSGKIPWNLNPYVIIQAPGLTIPQKILEKSNQGQLKMELRINCKLRDNKGKFHKRLPVGYVYDKSNDNWYLEP